MAIKSNKPTIKTKSYKVGEPGNVVQFPLNKPTIKRTQLENKLLNTQKLLRFHFKNIKEAMEQLAEYQVICEKTETGYDELLKEYADRIGVENVDKKYMDYSSHVKPVISDNGIELVFTDE